jgi:hypothetical protein
MSTEIDDAAGTIIELTNTLGASAAGVQNTAQAARTVRTLAGGAARHPGRLALAGLGLIVASGILAARRPPVSH